MTPRTELRTPDVSFYRDSAPFFAAMLLIAIPAFWPSYLHVDKAEADYHVHLHGLSLFLWALMLIAQPWLIRSGRWKVHRRLGRVSFVLAPMVVVSTLLLMRHRLASVQDYNQIYFSFIQAGLIALFAIAYAQAIRYRRTAAIHARYMVCTALTMVDPIVARLLDNYLDVPPVAEQFATFVLIDVIFVWLWMRDRRLGNGIRVFPTMLAAFLVVEAGTFLVPQTGMWHEFAAWSAKLPLP